MLTQLRLRLRQPYAVLARADNVFFRKNFSCRFKPANHAIEQLGQSMRKHFLAQSLTQHSTRERFALVISLQLSDNSATQTIETLTREIHTANIKHRSLCLNF